VEIESGGGKIAVTLRGEFDLSRSALMDWVGQCARAASRYFGKFPVPQANIQIVEGRRGGVSSGRSFGEHGAHCRISVGQHATAENLKEDWMLTHEMIHFGFPSVEENHHWMEEGSATYVEPIARVQIGWLTPETDLERHGSGHAAGVAGGGRSGSRQHSYLGTNYWGGAIFCLLADIGIRKNTKNKKGLQEAMRAINGAGGSIETDWPLERAFEIGDKATGSKTLMDLYKQMSSKPVAVDLPGLWKELGVAREDNHVTFDDHAPLAAIRLAITKS